jgi:hypothetical protein
MRDGTDHLLGISGMRGSVGHHRRGDIAASWSEAMTDSGNKRLVRPTLRCLLDDLAQEVGPDEVRVALRTVVEDMAADPTYLLPCSLVDIVHPVLDKANLIAGDDAAPRDRIMVITDRHVIKVKTGDRRAALWEDDAGTWWLLAAGRRKDDGSGDFYRELERFSTGSSPIAPTDADRRYQRLEEAYAVECAAERAAQAAVLGAVLLASHTPTTPVEIEVFGATVTITVTPDDPGVAVLEVGWTFDRYDEQDRFPEDVLAMVPGRENLDVWDYLPPRPDSGSLPTWYTYVPEEWVEHMATSAELNELLADDEGWTPINPTTDGSEHFSHIAKGSIVTMAYATGIEIIGLCGARVVAHRDYERFPICPACSEYLALLRGLRGPGEA